MVAVCPREREGGLAGFGYADLEHREAIELDRVLAVVEGRCEARMDVRDVESLEVVVEVQGPVGVHQVVPGAWGVERELVKRKTLEPPAHRGHEVVERHCRRERHHQETRPRTERNRRQVVRR